MSLGIETFLGKLFTFPSSDGSAGTMDTTAVSAFWVTNLVLYIGLKHTFMNTNGKNQYLIQNDTKPCFRILMF